MGNLGSKSEQRKALLQEIVSRRGETTLLLTEKDLQTVPEAVFQCTGLRTLNLSRNHIESISDKLGLLTALTSLFINQNALEEMPPSLGRLERLTTLSLQKNRLTQLPQLSQLHALTEIELQENALVELPEELGNIKGLKHLNINKNKVRALPKSLNSLVELQTLNATDNFLTALPTGLASLTKLRFLVLSGNKISHITDDMCSLKSLDTMLLDQNVVVGVPEAVTRLSCLTLLDLRMNPPLLAVPRWAHQSDCVYLDFPSEIGEPVLEPGRVFLGNVQCSENLVMLKHIGVTHILRAIDPKAQAVAPFPKEFKYHEVDCLDEEDTNLRQYFDASVEFIHNALCNEAGVILVHCRQGKSRSASLVLAYLIAKKGLSYSEAVTFVRSQRRHIKPNPSFTAQLKKYAAEFGRVEVEIPEEQGKAKKTAVRNQPTEADAVAKAKEDLSVEIPTTGSVLNGAGPGTTSAAVVEATPVANLSEDPDAPKNPITVSHSIPIGAAPNAPVVSKTFPADSDVIPNPSSKENADGDDSTSPIILPQLPDIASVVETPDDLTTLEPNNDRGDE